MTEQLELDGSEWQTSDDFYVALLSALGAPEWHGMNLDALADSLRAGDINRVNPPLQITISGIYSMSPAAAQVARRFETMVDELAKDGLAVDVAMAV